MVLCAAEGEDCANVAFLPASRTRWQGLTIVMVFAGITLWLQCLLMWKEAHHGEVLPDFPLPPPRIWGGGVNIFIMKLWNGSPNYDTINEQLPCGAILIWFEVEKKDHCWCIKIAVGIIINLTCEKMTKATSRYSIGSCGLLGDWKLKLITRWDFYQLKFLIPGE